MIHEKKQCITIDIDKIPLHIIINASRTLNMHEKENKCIYINFLMRFAVFAQNFKSPNPAKNLSFIFFNTFSGVNSSNSISDSDTADR